MSTNQRQDSREPKDWFHIPEGVKPSEAFTIAVPTYVARQLKVGITIRHEDENYEVLAMNNFGSSNNVQITKGRWITLVTFIKCTPVEESLSKDDSKSGVKQVIRNSRNRLKSMLKSKTARFLIAGGVIVACTLFGLLTAERD